MATDWTHRSRALANFEKALRLAKRLNDDDKEDLEQAVNALRRSEDHTAIQNRIKAAHKLIRLIAEMPASTHEIDRQLCKEYLAGLGKRGDENG